LIIILFISLTLSSFAFEYDHPFGMNSSIKRWWPNIFSDTTPPSHIDYKTEYKSYLDSGTVLGIKWWRAQNRFTWPTIQPNNSTWIWEDTDSLVKWTQERGIQIVPVFGYTADWAHHHEIPNTHSVYWTIYPPDPSYLDEYKEYVKRLVERYDGDGLYDFDGLIYPIKYWECMNEPYGEHYFLGTQKQYEEIFEKSYEAIKEVNSEAIILGPCIKSVEVWNNSSWGPNIRWVYYDTIGDSIAKGVKQDWRKIITNFIDNVTDVVNSSNIGISHHIYTLDADTTFKFIKELRDTIDSKLNSKTPIWLTETGYKWNNLIQMNGNYIYKPDDSGNFVIKDNLWFGVGFHNVPIVDTVLRVGELIQVPMDINNLENMELIEYNGGTIRNTKGQVILTPYDNLEVKHRFMRHFVNPNIRYSIITATPEIQAKNYRKLIDSIINNQHLIERTNILFNCLDKSLRHTGPVISLSKDSKRLTRDYYFSPLSPIIDSSASPLPAYNIIQNKIEKFNRR